MKYLALMAVLVLFMGTTSLALAQTTAAVPVVHHPRIAEVHTRMHDQMLRIKAGLKSGALTQDQANALMLTLKSVREQMKADFDTNGNKELTDAQLAQLNQTLDSNSKLIYGEKHSTSAPPSGSNSGSSSSSSSSPAVNSSNSSSNTPTPSGN
jgi:hypothetical protein